MWGRYITTGAILLLAATTDGLPLADDSHLVMGGHYKTNLGKRAEPVVPRTQPGEGLPPSVHPPTATTPLASPPGATTQLGPPGTTGGGGKNPPAGNGAVGPRPPAPGSNSQPMPSTGTSSNSAAPTPPAQPPVVQGQGGTLKPESQGTASGPGSPSPTGVKPSEKKEKTEKPGGVPEEDQNVPPQSNSKPQSRTGSSSSSSSREPKPKTTPTGSTDLLGAFPPSGGGPTGGAGIPSTNSVPTRAAPAPSSLSPAPPKPPTNTGLGDVGAPVPGGVSGTVSSVPSNIRPTATLAAGPPVGQGLQPSPAGAGQQFFVDPLNTPFSQGAGTPPGQVTPVANPAVQNPPLPGFVGPTLTQPLAVTGNQPPVPQQIPAIARRQHVNRLNPEKTSTTPASKSTKPQETKITEPKPKEEGSVPELRYELAGDSNGGKPETVGVSGPSSRTSSTTTGAPTPPPVTNKGQPPPQQVGGPQFYNPAAWVPPQLLYESVGGMIDTPGFYPNLYPPPNPGPVVMVNENTRTSTSPPKPTRSGPTLVHENIDNRDPDAAVVKAAPLPQDLQPTPKVSGRGLTLEPSSALRKVRRHGIASGPSHTDPHSPYADDLPLYENVGSTPERPAAVGPADSGSYTSPPNTGTQAHNPALLYESSGDVKDPVALPVIGDVSHTTTSATSRPSQGPALKYEYGAGDNFPGAGIPAPILPTETRSPPTVYTTPKTGDRPALKYEYSDSGSQQPPAYLTTITTTMYQPQPTPPPPALKHEYAGGENLVADPFLRTTTVTHMLGQTPAPGGGQPGLLYEHAGHGDPSPVQPTPANLAISYTTITITTTLPSPIPTPQGQQPKPKPLALRHENAGQGVTKTGATPTPTGGASSPLSGEHSAHSRKKRNEIRVRGSVGVDGVASSHDPGDHGKRVRRPRKFRA